MRAFLIAACACAMLGCDRRPESERETDFELPVELDAGIDAALATSFIPETVVPATNPFKPQVLLQSFEHQTSIHTRDLPAVTVDGKALVTVRPSGKDYARYEELGAPQLDLVVYDTESMRAKVVLPLRSGDAHAAKLDEYARKANAALDASAWRALLRSDDGGAPVALQDAKLSMGELQLTIRANQLAEPARAAATRAKAKSQGQPGQQLLLQIATRDGRVLVSGKDIGDWMPSKTPKNCRPVLVNAAARAEQGMLYVESDWIGTKPAAKCPSRAPHIVRWTPMAF